MRGDVKLELGKLLEDATEPAGSPEPLRGGSNFINSPIGNGSIVNSTVIIHARQGAAESATRGQDKGTERCMRRRGDRNGRGRASKETMLVELWQRLIVRSLEGLDERELGVVYDAVMKRKQAGPGETK